MSWFSRFLKEFEEFAVKGNVFQLAVGVVMGAAFNQVTTTLANNVLTPPVGALMGGLDFSHLEFKLSGSATIQYGLFLQALLNFIIIALALFFLIKVINRLTRKQEAKEKPPETPEEISLLREIRDELKRS